MDLKWSHDGVGFWDLRDRGVLLVYVLDKPPYRAHTATTKSGPWVSIEHSAKTLEEAKCVVEAVIQLEG